MFDEIFTMHLLKMRLEHFSFLMNASCQKFTTLPILRFSSIFHFKSEPAAKSYRKINNLKRARDESDVPKNSQLKRFRLEMLLKSLCKTEK